MNIENINVGDYLISIKSEYIFYVGERCVIDEISTLIGFSTNLSFYVVKNSKGFRALFDAKKLHKYFNTVSDHRKHLIDSLI